MDTLEAIHTRRSIRQYKPGVVSDETLREVLAAAMSAPSAGNEQPWHFVVVTDRTALRKIPVIHPYAAMAAHAPAAVLVCGDVGLEVYHGFWVQDCSAATQNILLAAHALGLGAVWCGVHPVPDRVEAFRSLFALPERVIPFALIPLGVPAEAPRPADRFMPDRIHRDNW